MKTLLRIFPAFAVGILAIWGAAFVISKLPDGSPYIPATFTIVGFICLGWFAFSIAKSIDE